MKRSLELKHIYEVESLSNPQISSDGGRIAFVKTRMDEKADGYRSDIWIIDGGAEAYRLSDGDGSNDSPVWSEEGEKLLYISNKEGRRKMYSYDFESDRHTCIIDMPEGIAFPSLSPDGSKLVFTSKKVVSEPAPVRYIRTMKQKKDALGGFIDQTKSAHLYIYDFDTCEITQLTKDDFCLDAPEWSGIFYPNWSSDSRRIVFTSKLQDPLERDKYPWKAGVYVARVDGAAIEQVKTVDGPAWKPSWSPDDSKIYFVGHTNEYQRATCQELCQIDLSDKRCTVLTETLETGLDDYLITDVAAGFPDTYPKFSTTSNEVIFAAGNKGRTTLYGYNTTSKAIRELVGGERKIFSYSLNGSGSKIVIAYNSHETTDVISVIDVSSGVEEVLYRANDQWQNDFIITPQEEIVIKTEDDIEVHGWLMRPDNYQEGKTYPTVLQIHGGPMLQFGWSFTFEFNLLTAMGYAVIFCNPRGSRGYGQKHTYALKDNYGGKDFNDIMSFVDAAIDTGVVDSDRMAVTGTSYGGFMTNWVITHTDRFKAAISQCSVSNWMSMYGISDFGYMINELLLMDEFEDISDLWKISPLAYIKNVNTPTLIMHTECDMRCPIDQGEQLYIGLKKLGKDVAMIRFPGENHMMMRSGKPSLRQIRLDEMIGYLDQHLK